MSKESSQEDAGRIQAIRDSAKGTNVPSSMIDHLIVKGIEPIAAAKAIQEYANTGYWVSACGSCAWGVPPRANELIPGGIENDGNAYKQGA